MAQITNCLKLISRINEVDQDSLISRIDELQALGVPAQRAQVQAAIDVLARLQRDAGDIQRSIKREQALETNVPTEMPVDPVFMAAVENTPGARVDDEGLHMRLVRWQKPEQEAGRAIRTGVFYLPEGSGNARHYRSAPGGDDGQSYGGSVKMDGDTLIRRPLFVRGATGGKAPEAAYAALRGKDAMKKLDSDVFGVVNERAWMTRQGADIYQERVENLLRYYGADPKLAADIIYHSRQGNQLRYALQENIIAHAVRAAGYDAVVGHSKGKSGPFISEVFDVREQTFPSNIIESEVHQDFSSDITRSASRLPAGVEIVEVEDGFDAMKDGKRIGRLRDNLPRGAAEQLDENASVDIVKVENEFKGQGVGAALYDAFHEKHGGRIAPSGKTSPEAWALWKRKFPQKVQEFVQAEAKRIRGGADPMMVVRNITDPEVARRVSEAAGDVVIRSAARQTDTRGLSPDSYEVRELSPEELEGIQFSAKRNDLGFYSALERGIEGMQTKQAPAGAWKTQIKGLVNKGIVKQDEVTWSGVEDWLDLQDGKVSKEAISEYLNSKAGKLEVLGRYADGESSGSIAKSIGIGETTVLRWVKSAGISRNASEARGVTKEKISEAVRLYGQGLSIAEVAKSVELGTSTIHRALVAAGVNRSLASVRDADARVREEALRLYASGMNTYEAAASVGVSQGTVASWAVAAGISRGRSGAQALRVAIGRHKTGRGIKAAFKSNKSGGELYAASLYELGRMHQLEADDGVASFGRSTDRIPYGDGRVYVPDLEVVSSEGNVFVEEIKPHIQLGDTDVLEKARAAEDFYKDKGKTYRLISEYAIGSDGFDRIDPDSFAQEDRDRVRSSLATIRWTLRQVADAEGEGEIALSRKRGWQGFPDSVVDTSLGAQSKDPSYEAAKSGDMKAALELVSRVMSSDAEDKVRSMIGNSKPIVVSVHAEEAAGRNKIPLATAIELGDRLGLEVDTKIVQATRAKRTGADGMARIGVQPEFTGDVVRGADYLIVDDTLTQGGTIAQLKTHIEEGGGHVVGAFTLSGKQYSAKISLDEQTLSQLREQYGSIEPWWSSELGYGFDGLTQSEARFILKSGLSPDQVRDRVAAARQAAGIGAGAQDQAQLSAKRDVTETPEFKRWFGDSKVVDADGKPLVVYHGTGRDVSAFDRSKIGSATDEGFLGDGFYFTDSKRAASAFAKGDGGNVIPAYLSIKNPYYADGLLPDYMDAQYLLDAGFDGVIYETDGSGDYSEYVALKPEQIKSAIGSNGNFDPANQDITKSLPRIPGLNAGPVERTTGDYGREYTPQQLRMFKNVGRTTSKPALIDRLKEAHKDLGKKMAQGIVDQFRPIRELGGNAYTLARLSKGSAGAFEALLGHGKLKIVDGAYDADTTGGFLDLVGKPLGKELEDFMFWVASNRAETLSLQDREHLFTQEDIDAGKSLADGDLEFDYLLANGATTRDRRAAYEDALKKFNEFNKNVLDIAEQSGLIDGESRQFWEGEFYVPFYRVSEEDGEFVGAKIKGGLARQRAFHELKGGSQKLNSDLLANTMRNWAHLIDASAKNRAAKATLEAAQAVGIALESDAETVRQLGKSMGGKGGTVWFMDGGQQRHFLIGDPYLLEAINSLEYAGLRGPLMDALSTMKHWLTVGVTASPAFKVRNLIRDSIQAISLSGLSYNPVKNLVEGYKATDRESQDYVSALASGGLIRFGTMLEGNAAERVRRLVQKGVPASTILNTPGKVKDFYGKFVEPAVEAYQELGNRGEEINRASLYKQLRAQGVNHAEASLMARDLMDFSMQGTWTSIRFLTQVVPFLNARLQGLYKLGRGAAEDPKRFAMVAGATAMVSIALLGAYGDDDDWKKREDWDRDGFWWFKFGGTAFRIPKPFEVGAIATLAERGVELFTNDEFTAKRFGSRVMHLLGDNLAMNPIPQAVKPMLDIYANKDSFSGRPIESMGMERLQSEYRYNVNTSMIARGASSALNAVTRTVGADSLSPVQIDSLIRGYFGWLGTFVVAGADMAVRPLTSEPARPQADYLKVVTQGFLRTLPEPGSKYVSAMYDQAKILEQAFATHRQMLKEGKLDEAREFAAENKDLLDRYRLIEAVKKTQSNVNRRIREIEISDMDPARKRDEIQKLRDQADRSARAVY